jgi:diaminopimelate epimerase
MSDAGCQQRLRKRVRGFKSMINFCKFEGFGNDYIVVAADELRAIDSAGEFAKKICDRHYGAGGDGIAVWKKLDDEMADFEVRIFNPDGSEAGFSGNGTRCAVAYLYYQGLWADPSLKLSTPSGIKNYTLLEEIAPGHYWFSAGIGQPKFAGKDIPMKLETELEAVSGFPLETSQGKIAITALNVGNPVCAIFVEDFSAYDWRRLGAEIETHKAFPARTNVVFVKVADPQNVEVRIWERGAGETSSSGTCSTAAAVAAAFTGKTGREVSVHAPGGMTGVIWREDNEMLLKGRADLVFCGQFPY